MQLDDLKTRFKALTDRVDAMSLRERGLIFITILAVLYVVAVNMLFGPLQAQKDQLQRQIDAKRQETRLLQVQIQAILEGGAHDPDVAKREKLASLEGDLKAMDTALAQVTSGLVPPKEMARLVEQMLLKNHGLRVMKVESLPAAPLLEDGGNTPGAMVYKHGMRIEFKGSYMDVLRYLRSLEGMPWKVFWGQVTLSTEKHPVSKVDLLIYTLSTHEGWIGL